VQNITTAGDANTQAGHGRTRFLSRTKSMVDQHFYNADGEMCSCRSRASALRHEFGALTLEPGEIEPVIPRRRQKFPASSCPGAPGAAYLCEKYGGAFHRCRSAGRCAAPIFAIAMTLAMLLTPWWRAYEEKDHSD